MFFFSSSEPPSSCRREPESQNEMEPCAFFPASLRSYNQPVPTPPSPFFPTDTRCASLLPPEGSLRSPSSLSVAVQLSQTWKVNTPFSATVVRWDSQRGESFCSGTEKCSCCCWNAMQVFILKREGGQICCKVRHGLAGVFVRKKSLRGHVGPVCTLVTAQKRADADLIFVTLLALNVKHASVKRINA